MTKRNINWSFWSSLAEIISSVAILATLIYLGIQTEQNNEMLRAQAQSALRTNRVEYFRMLLSDKELRGTLLNQGFQTGEIFTSMSGNPDEAMQIRFYADYIFSSWQQEYSDSIRTGSDPQTQAYISGFKSQPFLANAWEERKVSYAEDFRLYLDEHVFNQLSR